GVMAVCSSTEMGAPGASHLGTGDHGPKTDRSRPRSVPVNALATAGAGVPACHDGRSCNPTYRLRSRAHEVLILGTEPDSFSPPSVPGSVRAISRIPITGSGYRI